MMRVTVEVTGLKQVLNALEQTDKKAARTIVSEIAKMGKRVAVDASYLTPGSNPVSNWGRWIYSKDGRDLRYDPLAASASFKPRRNNFRRHGVSAGAAWDVYQTNAGAAVFEVIGSGKRVTTASGRSLVATINDRFPKRQPRSLFAAYYRNMTPAFREEIAAKILAEARKAGLV